MYTLSLMLMFYVKLFMKYGKAILFSMAAIFNIAKNGGSIKISGCFHQHSEIVWLGGHLCQISCFRPDVKNYYIKSPHYYADSILCLTQIIQHSIVCVLACVHACVHVCCVYVRFKDVCKRNLKASDISSEDWVAVP